MYRWYVEYSDNDNRCGIAYSAQKWPERWMAENNLDARMRATPPDIPMPDKSFVIDFGVEEVWS